MSRKNFVRFNRESISQDEYDALKKSVMGNEPVVKVVPITAIQILEDSIALGYIKVHGKPALVERSFFYDFGRIINVGKRLAQSLAGGRRADDDKTRSQKFLAALMQQCAAFQSNRGRQGVRQVTLIGNPKTGSITKSTTTILETKTGSTSKRFATNSTPHPNSKTP